MSDELADRLLPAPWGTTSFAVVGALHWRKQLAIPALVPAMEPQRMPVAYTMASAAPTTTPTNSIGRCSRRGQCEARQSGDTDNLSPGATQSVGQDHDQHSHCMNC